MRCLNSQVKGNLKMSEEKKSWDRQQGESSKAYAAFCAYRDLGITRSVMKVVEKCDGKFGKRSILTRWSIQHDWVRRCQEYDDFLEKQQRKELQAQAIEMTKRHLEQSRLLQKKAINALSQIDPSSLSNQELLKFIEVGMKLERSVLTYYVPEEKDNSEEKKNDETASRISKEILDLTHQLFEIRDSYE